MKAIRWATVFCMAAFASIESPPARAEAPATNPQPLRCPLTAAYNSRNVFARILRGEAPASVVAEDAMVIAIVPLEWTHPGHTLVIPRHAVRNLGGLTDADMVAVLHMVRRIAAAQQAAFGATGYSLQQNNAAHQDVCHAHFHVVPDTPDAPVAKATRTDMDAVAARLKAALPPG